MAVLLVVDDNEDNRDSLSRRLMKKGYEVLSADNGEAAIDVAIANQPDLILMDMNMPILDGWEATKRLRAEQGFEATPIIALTAYALTGDRERALEVGCTDYHTKPVEFERLLKQITDLLDA